MIGTQKTAAKMMMLFEDPVNEEEQQQDRPTLEEEDRTDLTPVTKCCLKKKCFEKISPKVQNELFNGFVFSHQSFYSLESFLINSFLKFEHKKTLFFNINEGYNKIQNRFLNRLVFSHESFYSHESLLIKFFLKIRT